MADLLIIATFLVCTFLLGAVPSGLVVTALGTDVDIRSAGSGNIGATNVYRLTGRWPGILTLAGDVLKGFVPTLISHFVAGGGAWVVSLTILAAFLGHCYSPYLSFRGGKGVATAMGAFLAAVPLVAIIAAGAWIGVVSATRKSSLAALAGLLVLLLGTLTLPGARPMFPVAVVVGLFIVGRHRSNIHRLLLGRESRV